MHARTQPLAFHTIRPPIASTGRVCFRLQVPNFAKLAKVSAIGAAASLTYSTLAWLLPAIYGPVDGVSYSPIDLSTTAQAMSVFNALANIAFAYGEKIFWELEWKCNHHNCAAVASRFGSSGIVS